MCSWCKKMMKLKSQILNMVDNKCFENVTFSLHVLFTFNSFRFVDPNYQVLKKLKCKDKLRKSTYVFN